MKQQRKICVVITARPSYSRIKSALIAIKEHKSLKLQLVIAASALSDKYGSVVDCIEKDGFKIHEKIFVNLDVAHKTSMAQTTGLLTMELSAVLNKINPDIVVVIADRYETLAVSIGASYQNICLAHVQGGEVTGNIDEKVRHCNTKLADIHLVATEDAKDRIKKMGEDPEYVINTGCPSIDIAEQILKKPGLNYDIFNKYKGVGKAFEITNDYLVVVQHPVTTEYNMARTQINNTLKIINELKMPTFWFWPNIDAGSDGTSGGIRAYREKNNADNIYFIKNIEPEDFLRLLYNSKCLIGNSSVGIRECSYLGVPVVNIGSRQYRRTKGKNVINVNYNQNNISKAISHQIDHGKYNKNTIYGYGNSGVKIAKTLSRIKLRYHKTISF